MTVTVSIDTARLRATAHDAAGDALRHELDGVLQDSKALVPVDTGDLRESGFVEGPVEAGSAVAASVGYDTPYALRQHEDLSLNHPHGGQAKFLEAVFNERSDVMAGRIGRAVAQRMGLR